MNHFKSYFPHCWQRFPWIPFFTIVFFCFFVFATRSRKAVQRGQTWRMCWPKSMPSSANVGKSRLDWKIRWSILEQIKLGDMWNLTSSSPSCWYYRNCWSISKWMPSQRVLHKRKRNIFLILLLIRKVLLLFWGGGEEGGIHWATYNNWVSLLYHTKSPHQWIKSYPIIFDLIPHFCTLFFFPFNHFLAESWHIHP